MLCTYKRLLWKPSIQKDRCNEVYVVEFVAPYPNGSWHSKASDAYGIFVIPVIDFSAGELNIASGIFVRLESVCFWGQKRSRLHLFISEDGISKF